MTIAELKAKIEVLKDLSKILDDAHEADWDKSMLDSIEIVDGFRNTRTWELFRQDADVRQMHLDLETIEGRS